MNHTKIRPQLKEGESREDYDEEDIAGYRMTNRRRRTTRAIGDCADHDDPHETKAEAAECYEAYVLREHYDDADWLHRDEKRRYVVCEEWGRWEFLPPAYSPLPSVWACKVHKAKATIALRFEIAEGYESWGSWSG